MDGLTVVSPRDFRTGCEYNAALIDRAIELPDTGGDGPTADDSVSYQRETGYPIPAGDRSGHGTAVASICAGTPTEDFPGGIAPDAELIVVRWDDRETSLEHCIKYIALRAQALGRPWTINLSRVLWNKRYADGDTFLERTLDSIALNPEFGDGRVIVVAAGNSNEDPGQHAWGMGNDSVHLDFVSNAPGGSYVGLYLLYESFSDGSEISVRSPDGQRSIPVPEGMLMIDRLADGRIYIYNDYDRRGLKARDQEANPFFVDMPTAGKAAAIFIRDVIDTMEHTISHSLATGTWTILLEGNPIGRWDTYIYRHSPGDIFAFRTPAEKDRLFTLLSPSTARQVIAVGSLDGGDPHTGLSAGSRPISPTSSVGPARLTGFRSFKPEVFAPGSNIPAALSRLVERDALDQSRIDETGKYLYCDGTSFAAPYITGLVAHILSSDPTLDLEKVRWLLTRELGIPRADSEVPYRIDINADTLLARLDRLINEGGFQF